ncbi:hypothetical protein ACFLUA_03410, partial [Chloroflexota bacterium]
ASSYLQKPTLTDPANAKNVIDEYLDEDGTRQELLNLIAIDSEIANAAFRYESEGDDKNALTNWRKIFESDDGKSKDSVNPKSNGPTIITSPPKQHCNVPVGIE